MNAKSILSLNRIVLILLISVSNFLLCTGYSEFIEIKDSPQLVINFEEGTPTNPTQIYDSSITVKWKLLDYVSNYEFLINDAVKYKNEITSENSDRGLTFTVPKELEYNKIYDFEIRAVNKFSICSI